MEKNEICKVKIGGSIYRVTAMTDDANNEHFFRVIKGRNIVKGGSYFNDKKQSIMFMLHIAFNDVAQLSLEDSE